MPFDVFYVALTGRFIHSNGRHYCASDIEKTESTMKDFDIYHLRDRQFNELSGGEKQRVLLCRVINMDSDIILLDEPFSGVDMSHQAGIFKILKKTKKAVMVVIHDLSFAVNHFDRFLFFKGGTLIYDLLSNDLTDEVMSEVFGLDLEFIRLNNKKFISIRGENED